VSEFSLTGRCGVITGGLGPLGLVMAISLAEAGATVLAVDLPEQIDQVSKTDLGPRIRPVVCDLLVTQQMNALVEKVESEVGELSFLINNAAFNGGPTLTGYACAFDDQTDEAFDAVVALNLAVPFRLSRRLTPSLRRSGHGAIVNIASIYGLVGPDLGLYDGTDMGNPAGYAASKGGLVQLTRYLATVLAPDIRVNCVSPGGIFRDQDPKFVDRYEARTPLRRMALEQDVVGSVHWLVSGASGYVTGQVVAVDGGWTAW
jgi:NAD(P)-dependent dehydrogenase (short-subunit alcohol dehydrogenase family)